MAKRSDISRQISIFDVLNGGAPLTDLSSEALAVAIQQLRKARNTVVKREQEEKRQRAEEKRLAAEEAERKRREHVEEVTCMDLPLTWENAFQEDKRTFGVHADSISDGLILCLANLGKVDIEYISAITGEDCKTVIGALKGSIYQNPVSWGECFYKGWETAEEYLSGNLRRKLEAARQADKDYDGYFSENIRAIEAVLPPAVAAKDIYVTLGSPWVPADIIDDFIIHLFGHRWHDRWHDRWYDSLCSGDECPDAFRTLHDELTGSWEIPFKTIYGRTIPAKSIYGTNRISALYILEKTLNMKAVAVTDEVVCPTNTSGKKRVINQSETILALEKQQKLITAFQDWIWKDAARKKRLEDIFEERFGCVRKRNFDGSFLRFPGMSQNIQLYPYQKNAVARIIFTPNTLLAHDVGAGKTYVMIAAGMELRRMGLSKKNLYVVPNSIVGQWKDSFLSLYPNANILSIEPRDFTLNKREKVLDRIRDEDFDGIIMAYSCFERIPLSKAYYEAELQGQKDQIGQAMTQSSKATSQLKRKQAAIEEALAKLMMAMDDLYDRTYFDELGITRLFVDEAHNYKNVPLKTQITRVLGINTAGSAKCQDMMDKVHMIQKLNNGGGVVFATGTPLTNSITDAYIMQMYLQSGELSLLDLQSFDAWVGMFAERSTNFEIDVDTSCYRLATRFSKFHNLPELTTLLSSFADFHSLEDLPGIPVTDGYDDALVSRTPEFQKYLENITDRAEAVRAGIVPRHEDNMLLITTDGRKAALDLRLVDPGAQFAPLSKTARCVENVLDIYRNTRAAKSTQLIFCDISTPKQNFNIYDEIRGHLLRGGVPADEIAYIHDAETEAQRNALFAKVRSGEIRILLGSTFKLGLGVNVQDRLIALHHLDVPWRPADMTQREGRILRQGNMNPKVRIFRYITEGSFDAYSWQLLESKQYFISELLSGSLTRRSASDIENTVLDYAEVKALAVGDPLIKERVETANELSRCRALQRKLVETRLQMEEDLLSLPQQIENQEAVIQNCEKDVAHYQSWRKEHPPAVNAAGKTAEANSRRALRDCLQTALEKHVLETSETDVMNYCGFTVCIPPNMIKEKPCIWLRREARYYVELGGTEVGNLIRIDNFLNDLPAHLEKLRRGLEKLCQREQNIRSELAKDESYTDKIVELQKKLDKLDKKLEVNKDE